MGSFSRLVRMLASRRQLCSSRHNVREREVEARRQACVGNRGDLLGGSSDSNARVWRINMEYVGSRFGVLAVVWSVC
jgi:hypothetical protein